MTIIHGEVEHVYDKLHSIRWGKPIEWSFPFTDQLYVN